jgi:hypothetical protein
MREIQTNNFQKKQADLITYPPVPGEGADPAICSLVPGEETAVKPKKRKKKIHQLNRAIDAVGTDR